MVDFREQNKKLRIGRGRPRKAAKRIVLIHLTDVMDICALSCDASVFTVMHKVFRQCRGATIGNQISPMLAGLTVSMKKEIYVRNLQSFFDSKTTYSSALGMLTTALSLFRTGSLRIDDFNIFFAMTFLNIQWNLNMLLAKMQLKILWF